jgi:MFS family permease
MSRTRRVLLGLLLFNGLSAAAGGIALMTDWIPEQTSWVRDTDFPSNYFPGVILMAVVGGSSLIAAVALLKRSDGWQLASIVAGIVMVLWIIGEVASIRGFHVLQVIYLVTGALVVVWTPAREPEGASSR